MGSRLVSGKTLTELVLSAQRLATSIPQRLRGLEALRSRRKRYTIGLCDSPGRRHGAVEQLPECLRDSMAVYAISLIQVYRAWLLTISKPWGYQRRTSRLDRR
jgi:hypothetical protein